ncbi:uncharacterized protein LODBEIA_P25540 [Lodderomyces beijingensis]|uniref:DHHA2 domain-containing protein n=1 Tax=Lodderomyces beijingensis TaxID=1775926 RepID=A0ABP0ZMA8_9ASCO
MSIRQYLVNLKQSLAQKAVGLPLHVVTGNQSADMDSVISSIAYAYLTNRLTNPPNAVIPIINIAKVDFKLRRDIVKLLSYHNITEDLLFFIEDYDNFVAASGTTPVKLNLVDHNGLQGFEINKSYDEGLVDVVGIIDHHADEGKFLGANPRIIRSCGSNSSLVFGYFNELAKNEAAFWDKNSDLVELLIGPLLVDTSNMTQKVEEPDTFAYESYKKTLQDTIKTSEVAADLDSFYKTLKTAKKDLSGFEFGDILRKDYKQFKFAGGDNVGFSSIGKSLAWVSSHFTKESLKTTLSNFLKLSHIELLVITSSYTQKENDKYTREFCYYYEGSNKDRYANLDKLVANDLELNDDLYGGDKIDPVVAFVNQDSSAHLKIYNQQNIKASRKQVVPVVKDVLESA